MVGRAVWIKEGPGIAQHRRRVDDVRLPAAVRSAPHRHHPLLPARERPSTTSGPAAPSTSTRPTASSIPREQWATERGMRRARTTPARRRSVRCSSTPAAGSARTGTRRNAALVGQVPRRSRPRAHEWDARWWSPITNAEHLAMRESVGMVDLTAFESSTSTGPGAARLPAVHARSTTSTSPSAAACTRRLLTRTVASAATSRSCASATTTSASSPARSTARATSTGSASTCRPTARCTFTDRSSGTLHDRRVGTERRDRSMAKIVTDRRSTDDVSQRGLPLRRGARGADRRRSRASLFRISYVGEHGWEIYTQTIEHGLRLWDTRRRRRQGVRHRARSASACTG